MADPTWKRKITVLLDFFSNEVILLIILIVFQSTCAGSATCFVSRALFHLIYSLVLLLSNTLHFWLLLCSEQMFAEALGCPSWGVRTPQVRTTAQKFGEQHPFYLKELLALKSWNATPWAGSALLDFIVQGKSITAECLSCQPHLREIRNMPLFWLWILNGPSAWAACPNPAQNKSSVVSVFSVSQEHTTISVTIK